MIAVMACITVNGTFKFLNSRTEATPTDPPPPVVVLGRSRLEEVVQSQAERIKALEARERRLVHLLGNLAEALRPPRRD